MYPRNTQRPAFAGRRFGKPSFGGSRFGGASPSSAGSYGRTQYGRASTGAPRRSFGGNSRRGGKKFGEFSDVTKFVNKAVITEQIEKFVPEHAFADFKIEERLKDNIVAKGYKTPTPIQDRAIPHVLMGRDVVGIANRS